MSGTAENIWVFPFSFLKSGFFSELFYISAEVGEVSHAKGQLLQVWLCPWTAASLAALAPAGLCPLLKGMQKLWGDMEHIPKEGCCPTGRGSLSLRTVAVHPQGRLWDSQYL